MNQPLIGEESTSHRLAHQVCRDDNETCAEWAGRGECAANPGYMLEKCKQSCAACPKQEQSDDALGVVAIGVRGGKIIDSIRFHCGNALGAVSSNSSNESDPSVSSWFGGDGGDECMLDCDGTNHSGGWRMGGLLHGLVASSGQRVDRIEMAKCSEDVEV